jgi:hypothetical protein
MAELYAQTEEKDSSFGERKNQQHGCSFKIRDREGYPLTNWHCFERTATEGVRKEGNRTSKTTIEREKLETPESRSESLCRVERVDATNVRFDNAQSRDYVQG